MVSPIQMTEISHFRAPYKDAYFGAALGKPVFAPDYAQSAQGYGVYEGVGDETAAELTRNLQGQWAKGAGGLLAMWGQNPWGQQGGGRGRARQRRGAPAVSGYGRGGADGFGAIPTPTGSTPIASLDPYFSVKGGITFATPATATNLDTTLQNFGATDPAFVVPTADGRTATIVFYHGMTAPPAGAEPGPYQPFAQVYTAAHDQVLKNSNAQLPIVRYQGMTLVDKQLATPVPGRRTVIFTVDPVVIATLAQSGGDYFLTEDEVDSLLLAASRGQLSNVPKAVRTASFFSSPFGVATALAAGAGVLYFAFGKKRRRA
jgi:hypothetical protein